jgi:phosphate transport system protein
MDMGLERLKNMVYDMAEHSEKTVYSAFDAYLHEKDVRDQIFKWSEDLRLLQDEVSELALEIIARYQPVASDLRYIRSCMEIAYGFSRFGRYAYDIAQVLSIFGDLSKCDKTAVIQAADQAKKMIRLSIKAFMEMDMNAAETLNEMDHVVDKFYLDFVRKVAQTSETNLRCLVSATLILRYIERIADHATYVGNSVRYVVCGERSERK